MWRTYHETIDWCLLNFGVVSNWKHNSGWAAQIIVRVSYLKIEVSSPVMTPYLPKIANITASLWNENGFKTSKNTKQPTSPYFTFHVHRNVNAPYIWKQLFFQAFSLFFSCLSLTSDVICSYAIRDDWIFFLASSYVWVQYVWHTERGICFPTVALWFIFVYVEAAIRLKDLSKDMSHRVNLCRPFAAHRLALQLSLDKRCIVFYFSKCKRLLLTYNHWMRCSLWWLSFSILKMYR